MRIVIMDCIGRDKCQRRKRRRRFASYNITSIIEHQQINMATSDISRLTARRRREEAPEKQSRCQQAPLEARNDLMLCGNQIESSRCLVNIDTRTLNRKPARVMMRKNEYGFGRKNTKNLLVDYNRPQNRCNLNALLCILPHLLICCIYQISCQRSPPSEPSTGTPSNVASGRQMPFPMEMSNAAGSGNLPVEARADPASALMKPAGAIPSNALDQFVSLLNSLQTNTNQNMRRSPLPLNGRGMPPMQQVPAQQQPGFQGPFNGQQFPPQQQQQNNVNNNNRRLNVPNQQPMFSISGSSPTPYLTLNRIANQASQQQQQQQLANNQQNSNPQNRFNPGNNQLPQPINTIPLGGTQLTSNTNRASSNVSPQMMIRPKLPQQGGIQRQQQQSPSPYNQLTGIPRPSLAPNLLQVPSVGPPVKPISGFAPSGPPPNSASNSAMVVVQSPSNAIGQAASSNRPVQAEPPTRGLQQPSVNKTIEDETRLTTTIASPMEASTTKDNLGGSSTSASTTTTTMAAAVDDEIGDNGNRESGFATNPTALIGDASGPGNNRSVVDSTPAASTTETAPTTISSSITGSSTSSEQERPSSPNDPPVTISESSWNPVERNRTSINEQQVANRNKLAPSPDIVTVPPGYNPDNPNGGHNQPQAYDIAVSAQMGGPVAPQHVGSSTRQQITVSETSSLASSSDVLATSVSQSIAPTAVTTIIWTPAPSETVQSPSSTSATSIISNQSSTTSQTQPALKPTNGQQQPAATRIRDNSLVNQADSSEEQADAGVVYGKPQTRDSKPIGPNPSAADSSTAGRPYIQPAPMDNQVRPFSVGAASTQQQQQQPPGAVLKSNHHHSQAFRPSRPLNAAGGQSPMHVGSGFTIAAAGNQTMPAGDIQDYVAAQPPLLIPQQQQSNNPNSVQGSFQVGGSAGNEPVISAQGGPDPASFDLGAQDTSPSVSHRAAANEPQSGSGANSTASRSEVPAVSQPQPQLRRRPTFKPKPAEPPIRIDSCIVDDDSSCDQSHNERCVTEYGISSCHCKPGYARLSQLRGYCNPVSSLQLSMKIDRLSDERRLAYNHTLNNSNTEEFQYLEFETIQALASAFQQTALAKQFMGARVNKFFERKGKVWANVSINFDANNVTKTDKIQSIAANELYKVTQSKQKPLGDSTIMLDGSKESISRLVDVNECSSRDLNDCSKYASCTNEFGGFQCQCLPGFEDKHASNEDKAKHGRVCLGCSPSFCSNRGECSISDGQKQCKCRPNFVGARCDYDTEVLAVAIGGSIIGVIILVVTCWCLYVFNRRWKREQQKMDAMSATSGLTYNYINSASTNSLMSPTRMVGGGLHRSGGHQVGSVAANYGQRFGAAIANQTRGDQHYAPDQQAIIGSTSSGSSAASQPIGGCNPYTASGYQYEDAGLLIASASTGSSEQTSPTSNSYRDIMTANGPMQLNYQMLPGNAYTLSGHHHHHHQPTMHHRHTGRKGQHQQITQFHPAATDYRTLNVSGTMHCQAPGASGANYDNRWRTLRQENNKQSNLVGYYLNPEMLTGQHQQQQQLYASPKRIHCDWN